MLNKKYYIYAVSLAIFSFSQVAASDFLSPFDYRNVSEEMFRAVSADEKEDYSLFSYEDPVDATQDRIKTLLEVIHQKRERATQATVAAPHEWEVAFGVVDASEELFVAKSIDFVFELLWGIAEDLRGSRIIIDNFAFDTLGNDRASELFAYFDMSGSLQDIFKKEITTIDKLEPVLGSVKELLEAVSLRRDPSNT